MFLKTFLFLFLLFEAIIAGEIINDKRGVSYSIDKIWKSNKNDPCNCSPADKWKKGVQEHFSGLREASYTFKGFSYEIADNAVLAYEKYLAKMMYFTDSNSTVLASSSFAMLSALSRLNKLEKSGEVIMKELNNELTGLMEGLEDVVNKLSPIIGDMTRSVNDAWNDFGYTLGHFMTEFLKIDLLGKRKKVDFKPVIEQGQVFANIIALIAETLLNKCENANRNVYEAVTVLSLISGFVMFMIQGVNACQLSVLLSEKCDIPQKFQSCSISLQYVVIELTESVTSVTMPLPQSLTVFLTKLINITLFLNSSLQDVLGVFEGVTITVGQITQHLTKTISNTVLGSTKNLRNILKGVSLK